MPNQEKKYHYTFTSDEQRTHVVALDVYHKSLKAELDKLKKVDPKYWDAQLDGELHFVTSSIKTIEVMLYQATH